MNLTALVKTTARGSRWIRATAAVILLGALLALPAAPSGASSPDDEATFVALINNLRTSRGLNALVVDPELTAQARRWTDVMAADDQLKHAGDLSSGISTRWDLLGENVGVHTVHDINGLFQAFVASPHHLENLLDPRFEYVGVGVTITPSGKVWTTHRFMSAPPAPAPAPPPPPPPPPAPAPRLRLRRRPLRRLLRRRPLPGARPPGAGGCARSGLGGCARSSLGGRRASGTAPHWRSPARAGCGRPRSGTRDRGRPSPRKPAPVPSSSPLPGAGDPGPSPDALAAGGAASARPASTLEQLALAAALGVTVVADQQAGDDDPASGPDGQPFSNDPFHRDPFDVRPLAALLLDATTADR
ncbi:MAG: CAP domain-containing protein [Acidimicrobiales bacterium]